MSAEITKANAMPDSLNPVMMRSVFRLLFNAISERAQGQLKLRSADERKAAFDLIQIGDDYFGEMNKCLDVDAMFAAIVMACSGLEMLLMLACLCYQNEVTASKAWRKSKKLKKAKTFVGAVARTELVTLIELAEELGWFCTDVPVEFKNQADPDELAEVLAFVPPGHSPAIAAAGLAKDIRNHLHPGNCLRMNRRPDDPKLLLRGVAFVGLALSSFIKQHDTEKSSEQTPVPQSHALD